ncbi:MAG: hypothetical protein ABI779_24490 [Acidobacteriota bacterium]
MSKVVAIGGTGQLIAYHYLQLYLLGVVQEPFELVVIDTDKILDGITRIQTFLSLLRTNEGQNRTLGAELPVVTTHRISAPEGNAFELLSGQKNAPLDHPVRAFFDRETGQQPLAQGLFARPALSSVVSPQQLSDGLLMPAKDAMTVAVGSIIGGTSGGLLDPIIDRMGLLADRHDIKSRIRAVLFGQYFAPDEGRGIQIVRLQSNELLVMRAAREALDRLDLFHVVGGPDGPRVKRLTDKEKDKGMPWPDSESHPVWDGVKALDFLLNDTVMPFRDRFEDREVTSFDARFDLKRARQRLSFALAMARALVSQRVLDHMVVEPWLRPIWGKKLPDLISHYWRIAAKAGGGWERVGSFPGDAQGQIETLWVGQGDDWGIGDIFPSLAAVHAVKPGGFARVQWPEVDSSAPWDRRLFVSADETARRTAAVLLFWSLRTGV